MTLQEHELMIGMFAKHLQLIKALAEALKSHGILERGDFAAFVSATTTFAGTADGLIDGRVARVCRAPGGWPASAV